MSNVRWKTITLVPNPTPSAEFGNSLLSLSRKRPSIATGACSPVYVLTNLFWVGDHVHPVQKMPPLPWSSISPRVLGVGRRLPCWAHMALLFSKVSAMVVAPRTSAAAYFILCGGWKLIQNVDRFRGQQVTLSKMTTTGYHKPFTYHNTQKVSFQWCNWSLESQFLGHALYHSTNLNVNVIVTVFFLVNQIDKGQ